MTREESIEVLEKMKYPQKVNKNGFVISNVNIENEALDMAIRALSQEPCDDAVSRDFQIGDEVRIIGSDPIYDDCDVGWVIRNASEKVKTMYVMRNDGSAEEEAKAEWYKTGRHNAILAEVIKALPSVTPKSGKWITDARTYYEELNKRGLGVDEYTPYFTDDIACSECLAKYNIFDNETQFFKHCPNCGADMRGAE